VLNIEWLGAKGAPDNADRIARYNPYVRRLMIGLVILYRATLGQLMGGQCRYEPSCSQYAIDAINKYGAIIGGWKALKRICRCHPWGGRGYDPA
jgi:putative membrane protein insertion efficiency factor